MAGGWGRAMKWPMDILTWSQYRAVTKQYHCHVSNTDLTSCGLPELSQYVISNVGCITMLVYSTLKNRKEKTNQKHNHIMYLNCFSLSCLKVPNLSKRPSKGNNIKKEKIYFCLMSAPFLVYWENRKLHLQQ